MIAKTRVESNHREMKKIVKSILIILAVSFGLTACNTPNPNYSEHSLVHYYETEISKNEEELVKHQIDSVLVYETDSYILSVASYLNGRYYYNRSDYHNAFKSWQISNEFLNNSDHQDYELEISINKNIGVIYKKNGLWQKATEHYAKALEIAQLIDHKKQILSITYNIGNALAIVYADSVPSIYYEGLSLAKEIGQTQKIVQIRTKLGYRLTELGKFKDAEEQLYRAYQLAQENENVSDKHEVNAGQSLGHCLTSSGKLDKALKVYQDIYKIHPRMITAMDIGEVYLNKGDTSKAVKYWKIAESMYSEEFRVPDRYKIFAFLSTYDEANQLHYLKRHKEESEFYITNQNDLNKANSDHFYYSFVNEKQNQIAKQEFASLLKWIYILAGFVLFVFVFAFMYQRILHLKQNKKHLENEEKLKKFDSFLDEIVKMND